MANHSLLALTFSAILAFSAVSAYKTTITTTTTTVDDNGVLGVLDGLDSHQEQQCRMQILIEQLNHCQMHLTQGIRRPFQQQEQQHLQQCCSQLKNVNPQCQCDAIQQVFDKAWQQGGLSAISQIASKAYRLPNDCGLEVQDCPLRVPRV